MNKLLSISLVTLFGSFLVFSTPVRAQENAKKEKKVRVKTVKVENGKELVTDTTFVITEDMTADELKAYGITTDGDEVDVTVDVIVDGDGKHETTKVVVIKGGDVHSAGEETILFHSGDSDGKAIIMWTDEDGKEMEIDLSEDYKNLMLEIESLEDEIEVIEGERIIIMKSIDELGELDELKDFNVKVVGATHHPNAFFIEEHSHKVTDIELRDAGLKNKPNRLDAEEMNINIDNGIVDFSFKTKVEGSPKITVYNVYGDKVFSGKPELMNGAYEIKMDLSQKQYGMYYLQVVIGNTSFTERLKL